MRVRPGDNLMIHKALTLAQPGDVIVAEGELPILARGHSHRRPSKDGPGEINVPISCAGLAVAPGDLVLGDADGVIAVSPGRLPQLLEKVRAKLALEEEQQRHHLASRTDPSLFALDDERATAMLREKGCPV